MDELRLDKWLWAARFFKTRPLAQKAIDGGKVKIDGTRAKPGKALHVGQQLEIRCGFERYEVVVRALSERRGPASVARELYEESEESRQRREREALERKAAELSTPDFGGRPDKQQRRRIRDLLERNR
jgi:ribosome-associated heat shock protein Hsp15